jgi:hypothetical protein
MSDRKYRQRGYQDDPRDRERQAPKGPSGPRERPEGPRTPNLMASHEVFKCGPCGHPQALTVADDAVCERCGVALHSCVQCVSFDPGSPLECMQAASGLVKVRIAPKDAKNTCPHFSPRTTIERQTSTPAASRPNSARQAFDDLFKF